MDKKFVIRFSAYWIVNALVLALANSFFLNGFTLGNAYLNVPQAALFSGFLLTVLLLVAKGLVKTTNFKIKGRVMMFVYYWGASSAAIWIIARAANVTGFGISRFTWAIACGFVVAFTNWLLRQAFKGVKLI